MSFKTRKSDTHEELYFQFPRIKFHSPDVVGATIFARLEADGWWLAPAFCHRVDQFDRKRGRNIARRRYFQGLARHRLKWHEKPRYEDLLAFLSLL